MPGRVRANQRLGRQASCISLVAAQIHQRRRQGKIKHRKCLAQLHGSISGRIHYQHSKRLQSQTGWSPLSSIAVMPAIRR